MKLEVPKELMDAVEENQILLKKAIIFHQTIYQKVVIDLENQELRNNLTDAEHNVVKIGLEQKVLLQKLRAELSNQRKIVQKNNCKSILEEKKQLLSSNLVRSRKQKIAPKASPRASCSDDSNEDSVKSPSPKYDSQTPESLAKIEFLKYLHLTTMENFKEMQNKRVERKRRSTVIKDFIYETDLPAKRKKITYPSSISPPNTRQAVKKKNGRGSPPTAKSQEQNKISKRCSSESLTEIVNENTSEERNFNLSNSLCKSCKSGGAIYQCEICMGSFHENCAEPTVLGSTRRCKSCTNKKLKNKTEKIVEKQNLEDENENLCAQLTQLQERHSELSISLKNQKVRQEELLSDRQNTEEKIKCLLNFIDAVKRSPVLDGNT